MRTSADTIDHFSPTLDNEKLKGACSCRPDDTLYVSTILFYR